MAQMLFQMRAHVYKMYEVKDKSIIASNLHCGNEVTNEIVSDQAVPQQHLTEHQMQILPCQFGQLQDLICINSSCKLY